MFEFFNFRTLLTWISRRESRIFSDRGFASYDFEHRPSFISFPCSGVLLFNYFVVLEVCTRVLWLFAQSNSKSFKINARRFNGCLLKSRSVSRVRILVSCLILHSAIIWSGKFRHRDQNCDSPSSVALQGAQGW